MQKKFLIAGSATLVLVLAVILYITLFTTAEARIRCPYEANGAGVCPERVRAQHDATQKPCPMVHFLPKGTRHTYLPEKQENPDVAPKPAVTEVIPDGLAGWISQDVPLSDNELMSGLIGTTLAFDSYAYRFYQSNTGWVSVYVAYWRPGKVSTTDAGVHNPDSCWTNAGWTQVERLYGAELLCGGRKLKPVEYGVYERPGEGRMEGKTLRAPVIFWHLVGGEVNRYETQWVGYRSGLKGRLDRVPLFLEDLKRYGLNQRREQMFVRVTLPPDKTLEGVLRDADFVQLLTTLAPLGIFEGTDWGEGN
jgi:hypothetical protein